jgi:hypothetical protein
MALNLLTVLVSRDLYGVTPCPPPPLQCGPYDGVSGNASGPGEFFFREHSDRFYEKISVKGIAVFAKLYFPGPQGLYRPYLKFALACRVPDPRFGFE